MWEKWKTKFQRLFSSKDQEDFVQGTEKNVYQKYQSIQARVTYEYPKTSRMEQSNMSLENIETPAFQRQRRESRFDGQTLDENNNISKENEFQSKNTFRPTDVPSPIYGYSSRNETTKNLETPAFVRRQKEVKEKIIPITKDVNNIHEVKIESHIDHEELSKHEYEKEEKTNESEQKIQAHQEDSEIKNNHSKINKEKEVRTRKKAKHHPNSQRQVPFNVMMTPRDKRNYQKAQAIKKQEKLEDNQSTYHLPLHLLKEIDVENENNRSWIQEQQNLLEKTLKHFNVKAKVVNATEGPTVTRFEVQPEMGVKVSRVRNLTDDIKLNMAAKDIRIEAPIPGKHTIGIEVPNLNTQTVRLKQIFETDFFQKSSSPLTICLGLDVEGKPVITDIGKMPHGLIAGATGSGKSVCINTILISILYKARYDEVKLLLIDPKMVELAPYNDVPHLISPVITDVKAATAALKWAVGEMEERYELFVQEKVRSIEKYNERVIQQGRNDEKLPFIVIVIDELADLMMSSPQDVEDSICKLAQKARACGIHLILATQRPSVDVITGLIKANIPTRIAFSVSSQVDSRTIIDMNGAERLLGKGDMLFFENGSGKAKRLQGAFVSDQEIENVTNYVKKLKSPNYLFEQDQLVLSMEMNEDHDELFDEVFDFVTEQNKISTSLLQRHFRIGYNRAARLIDVLENEGIISAQNGSKPRDVLISNKDFKENVMYNKNK